MDKPLAGVTVVVTRPVHQAEKLCQLIESRGGNVLRFPTLEITAPGNQTILAEIIQRLADFNIAIFISPNAVEWGMKFIHKAGQLPTQLKIAAVGQGTANKLSALARPADIFPTEQFNSEALLAMDELGDVSGKHIVIFRGEGGRETLAETLRNRGAIVEYAECYQRSRPNGDVTNLLKQIHNDNITVITVTSNEALQNLFDMVEETHRQHLLNTPLIVVSDRGKQLALELGFNESVIVANKPSDEAILAAVLDWKLAG